MKDNTFARKQRQLKSLIKELQFLLSDQSKIVTSHIKNLILKITRLLNELKYVIPKSNYKKVLGGAATVIGISFTNQTVAQSFAAPQATPFGLDSTFAFAFPSFTDLDNDGDLDLLVGEYYGAMQYFENIGTATNPQFDVPQANPFGLVSGYEYSIPSFVDLDNDGDMDLLIGEYYGDLQYFENIGTAANPQFDTPQANPFGLISGYGITFPSFADLDNDGDFDLIVGEFYGVMQYFENIGTAANPQFDAPQANPFGLVSTNDFAAPKFVDLDGDGDMDLLVGEYYGTLQYFENIGTATNPQFDAPQANPFGIAPNYGFSFPSFADLDDDADMDLLVGGYYGALNYYENTSVASISKLSENLNLKLFPNPTHDEVIIETSKTIEKVEITDLNGRILASYKNGSSSISLKNLSPGQYNVKIILEQGGYVVRQVQKQ